ncbi:MAG: NADH-quinone oxidoreductase subunit N [Planctomycetes bacterium]|nr:NADH-quinone oxidoreductase subunit N [Planctomycetota bacterium]
MNSSRFLTDFSPELILLVGACLTLLVGLRRGSPSRAWESAMGLLVILAALFAAVALGLPKAAEPALGLWPTPLTFYVRGITLLVGTLLVLVGWHQPAAEERGEYVAMLLFSLLGVLLTASANDWVVLFFTIELVSVPTYVLIALSRLDPRASEASVKYFFLGALAAAILAYGLSFLYGATGTTTIHQAASEGVISSLPAGRMLSGTALIGLLLTFAGLAFKIAAVPFHVYAPDVYEGAASPITGLLGFVPKFAGFVALVKLLAACQWELPREVLWVLWSVAAVTMTAGNVVALLQTNVKRMLAYSSIAHTGYMLVALLVGPTSGEGPMRDGVVALLFYIAVYAIMNLGVFAFLTGLRIGQRDAETLDDIAGVAARAPAATLGMAVCAFSLMGLPPTAGFLGKLYVFSSAFSVPASHDFHGPLLALAILGVVNSAIGAAYYLRIVAVAYMGKEVEPAAPAGGAPVRIGLTLCTLPVLLIFAWPTGLMLHARQASTAVRDSITAGRTRVTTVQPWDAGGPSPLRADSGGEPRPRTRAGGTAAATPVARDAHDTTRAQP